MKTKTSLFERQFAKINGRSSSIFQLDVHEFCNNLWDLGRTTDRQKIDALLELDAVMYTNLGIDSTKGEKTETKRKSRIIYNSIKKYDKTLGDLFLNHMDKKT